MGAPVCSASIPATSQEAVSDGRVSRAIRGNRRAVWAARASPVTSSSGSERSSPMKTSRTEPYMSGLKFSVIEPPKTSAATCASAVQPACESSDA